MAAFGPAPCIFVKYFYESIKNKVLYVCKRSMSSTSADGKSSLQALVHELNNAVDSYDPQAGLDGFCSRAAIIEKAKKIMQLMMDPGDLSMHHSTNMTELVAIRTMMKFGVLQRIPDPGSISLKDLSKATGVQESLLGSMFNSTNSNIC